MKQYVFIIAWIYLVSFKCPAQNLFVADYTAGGGGTYLSLITYDRCFFSAVQEQNGAVTVMKTDSAGNVLWANQIDYQSTGFFQFAAIEQAADSGFLLLLNITQPGGSHSDPTVTKIDQAGNYLWTQHYISFLSAFGYSIIKNNDNGFMVTGTRQQNDFVMKCDYSGLITWIKKFHFATGAGNYDITSHDYSRFAITGRQGSNMVFFETDLTGNLYWQAAISFANTGILGMSMIPASNGGYVIAGRIKYVPGNYLDAFLLKTDSAGAVQWMKVYSASNETSPYDVVELVDGSLLMVGYNQGTNGNGFALKTDQVGNLLFSKTELQPAFGQYGSVHPFTPGTVMLSGRRGGTFSFVALADTACSSLCNINPFIIQEFQPVYTDTLLTFIPASLPFTQDSLQPAYTSFPLVRNILCGSTSVMEASAQNITRPYPNPVTDNFIVTARTNVVSIIIIFDMNSRKLMQEEFTGKLSLNVSKLSGGMYLYEVINKNGVITKGKFIKE